MATNPATAQLYPLSTRDGESIPLEVMGPAGLIVRSITLSGVVDFTLPASFVIGSLYSEVGCILQFAQTIPNPPVNGTEYSDAVFVPPQTLITSTLTPGPCRLISLGVSAGTLYIQNVQKWAALALSQQLTRK